MKRTLPPLLLPRSAARAFTATAILLAAMVSASAQFPGFGGGIAPGLASESEGVAEIRFGPGDASVSEKLRRELRIMARVFERRLGRSEPDRSAPMRMGIPLLLSPPSSSVQILYLDGYGALVSLEVDHPLEPPRTVEAGRKQPAADSDWDAARRELEGDSSGPSAPADYDPTRVARLKERLVSALRQGTNLVHLAPGDVVAVVVRGPAPSGEVGTGPDPVLGPGPGAESGASSAEPGQGADAFGEGGGIGSASGGVFGAGGGISVSVSSSGGPGLAGMGMGSSTHRFFRFGGPGGGWTQPAASASVLTLRVKKAELDALAAGTLSPESFAEKVTTYTYLDPVPPRTAGVAGQRF